MDDLIPKVIKVLTPHFNSGLTCPVDWISTFLIKIQGANMQQGEGH